jgi:hypothetical protein
MFTQKGSWQKRHLGMEGERHNEVKYIAKIYTEYVVGKNKKVGCQQRIKV